MQHEHDPEIQLNGLIKCRTCGEPLLSMEEEITKVSSAIRVVRVLQEIAVAGKFRASSFEGDFVVYARDRNGNREEITGQKLNERSYRIFKRTISVEGGDTS